jgi:hypothetical protein
MCVLKNKFIVTLSYDKKIIFFATLIQDLLNYINIKKYKL